MVCVSSSHYFVPCRCTSIVIWLPIIFYAVTSSDRQWPRQDRGRLGVRGGRILPEDENDRVSFRAEKALDYMETRRNRLKPDREDDEDAE